MSIPKPTRASALRALFVLALLLVLSLVLARVSSAQEPTPTDASANTTYVINDDPDVASIIYRFTDFGNDWQTLAPELGPIGSIHFYRWEAFHTGPNQYNWNVIDVQLAKEAKLKVTLLNNQIIPKPVFLQVVPFLSNNPDRPTWTAVFYDSTPEWVYAEIEAATGVPRPIIDGRKVGYVMQDGGFTSVLPMYDNPIWQKYHWQMIAALGARYNNHPQITGVGVSTGLDAETHATKDYQGGWNAIVDAQYPGVRAYFTQFVYSCMDHYRAAFPDKPLFLANAPGGSALRWQTSQYASQIEPPIGLRHCGMWEDLMGHQGGGSFVGLWDSIRQYSMTLPIWIESAYGFGAKDTKYWSWLAALHYHPDAIDVHREWLTDTSPDVLRWVSAHLGVSLQDTPSVWTALRDTYYPVQDWGTGQASGHLGDWTFWLTRQEIAGGGTVRVWRDSLPVACRTQLYSTQARRTDQANGQTYMYFNIDDGYPFVGQVPLNEPDGTVSYSLKLIFLNQGSDTISLQYRNYAGEIVSRTLTKGAALGPVNTFITRTFTLEDAYFNNNLGDGTSDFRISCNGDGDEVVHFVEVSGLQGRWPTPTPTSTPTRTATATATRTATPTPSNTPTNTPTYTPVPVNQAAAADASIDQAAPTRNRGAEASLAVSATGDQRALLYFDIGQVPVGAGALQARLRLRSLDPAGEAVPVLVYGLRRAWVESEVTWERATAAAAWALGGADAADLDRDLAASAATVVSGGEVWYEWDVTEIVSAWTKGLVPNSGLLLMATNDAGGVYHFASSESSDPPQLLFSYALATPTASPTATRTPTPTVTPGPTATPTATSIPTPTVLPGGLVFAPTADTYISEWYTSTNYCRNPRLVVRQGDVLASLLYFDLSAIPPGTTINSATLNMFCTERTNTGEMNALAYKVRHPWTDCEVSWLQASASRAWTVAGCNGLGTDRDQVTSGGYYMNSTNAWYSMNITQAVRDWVADPASNHGLVLKGYGTVSVEYSFASNDNVNPLIRPRLIISAGPLPPTSTPTITLTPTASHTPSPSPTPSITPLPTNTLTPSATPTASQTPSITPSPTVGPSPTPSNTPQPSATPTPRPTDAVAATPTPPAGAVRFEATADTTLNSWGPSENLGDTQQLLVRQPNIRAALLAFDTSSIPQGAYVYKATLNLYIESRTNIGALYVSAHMVKRPWLEDEATWSRARIGVDWQLAGCNGGDDRELNAVSTEIFDLEDAWFNLNLTSVVQQWVNNPASNNGIALRSTGTTQVEYALGSREAENVYIRPHLYVLYGTEPPTPVPPTPTYTPANYPVPDTATPTPTPTATATITPGPSPTATATGLPSPTPAVGAQVIPLTRDTYLNEWSIDKTHGTAPELFVRNEGVKVTLLHVPTDSLPTNEYILSAKLHLYVTARSNAGILYASLHQLLREWDEATATWILAATGNEWQQSGCKQVGVDRSAEVVDEIELNTTGAWVTFDITSAVRDWLADPASNHGLTIVVDGTVFVEYAFASGEHSWPGLRPWVDVVHSTTSPVPTYTPTITLTPTLTRTPTPVPTATPRNLPTAVPGQITVFSGSDAILNAWVPTENTGIKTSLHVRQGNIKSTLMRFNLGNLPANLALAQARLRLYVTESSNYHDLTLKVYRLRRDWRERETTWYLAAAGSPWSVAGCDGTNNGAPDRDATPLAEVAIPEPGSWFEIDLTSVVADWLAHPDENYGVLLKGDGPVSVEYEFGSYENETTALRPVLIVVPASTQPTPTPVVQATPTPVGASQYFGAGADVSIDAWFPLAKAPTSPWLRVRGGDAMASLLRFDLANLPNYSQVHQATLQLYVLGSSNANPLDVGVYRVVRPWTTTDASWERATVLVRWAAMGCNASSDRLLTPAASLPLTGAGQWVSVDITSLVDYWTQHPAENYGLVLKSAGGAPVSYDLASFDHPVAAARPRLLVDYTSAPPTPTPTPVQTIVTVVVNTDADADLNSWSPDTNYGATAYLPLYTFGQKRPLYHFSLDVLPPNAVITQATFKARTLDTVAYPMNVQVVGMLRSWSEYQSTWKLARTGVPWTTVGADGIGTDRLGTATSSRTLLGDPRWWEWDVTSLVSSWSSGALANNGLMLLAADEDVRQQVYLSPREAGNAAQLIISYFVSSGGSTTLSLKQGHNMVSFPVIAEDPSFEAVLAPIADRVVGVWAFDSDDGDAPWQVYLPASQGNTLTTVDPRLGYWIEVSSDASLALSGASPAPQTIALHRGWNLIGYPCLVERPTAQVLAAIADRVTIAWYYDAASPTDPWKRYVPGAPDWANTLVDMRPTRGYWILVVEDCSLTIP